jgi:peptide/nickel transport system substrate-binding protein
MRSWVTVGLAILVGAAGSLPANSTEGKRGGKLVIAQDEGPDRIDPHGTSNAFQYNLIISGLYESLLSMDKDFKIHPSLASEWVQESPTSYLFTIRPGVKFHDGSAMTAEDVVFTFDRIFDPKRPNANKLQLRMIKSVTAVDGNKVRIELKEPSAPFLRYIAAPETSGIVSKKFTLDHNNDLTKIANGTGPFKITRFQPGVIIEYVKFADYWQKGLPYLDGVELRIIPDDSTRIAALRTGEIDMTFFRPDKRPLLATLRNVTLSNTAANAVEPIRLNCTVPPLDKLEVRQALSMSIDKMALMKTVMPGGLSRPSMMIPPEDKQFGYQGNGSDLPFWKQDHTKAKALLAAAGFPNGVQIKAQYINTPAFAVNGRIAEVVKQQVAPAGINLVLEPVEYSALIGNHASGKWEVQVTGRGMYPDPEGSLTDTLSDNPRTWCKDPKVDDLVNRANRETDVPKRAGLLDEAQKYILQQGYWIFLFADPLRIEVWRNNVKGYEPLPLLRRTSLRSTWVER